MAVLSNDEGKYLVDAAGEQIDFVSEVDEDDIGVSEDSVETVTDEEIRVSV